MSDNKKKYSVNNMMLAFIAVLVAVGLVALAGFFLLTPPDEVIMGQAEARFVYLGKYPDELLPIVLMKVIR